MGQEEDSRAGVLRGQMPFSHWEQGPANARAGDRQPAALQSSSPCCRAAVHGFTPLSLQPAAQRHQGGWCHLPGRGPADQPQADDPAVSDRDLLSPLPATQQSEVPLMGTWQPIFMGAFHIFAACRKTPSEGTVPGK